MSDLAATSQVKAARREASNRLGVLTRLGLFWVVMAAAAGVYSQSRFWTQPSAGDRANWDYFAQVIARGGVPYRDVVNIKSPLSAYIGAAAIMAARPFGLRDVLAIRFTFILLAALTVAFTFLVALEYLGSRGVALLAATIMLTFSAFARLNGGGTQPKTPMVLFGLITLWAIIKDGPFAAGLFGMLSALSWQPGLLFVGAAGLAFSRYLTSWRDMKAARVVAGAAVPLAAMLMYFWAAGAIREFYLWNIHFNATVYGPNEMRPLSSFINRLAKMLAGTYHNGRFYFYLAAPGLLLLLWREAKLARGGGRRSLLEAAPRHALIIAPVVYFLFCMIDIQGGADLIPLLPFVAVFAAVALLFALERAASFASRARPDLNRARVMAWGSGMACAFILILAVGDTFSRERDLTLQDQDAKVRDIVSQLQPGDKIFVHGQTEILVLSGLTNASKYFLLDRGKDAYLDVVEEGGFDGWLRRLKAERPRIVALDRLKSLGHLDELRDWVEAEYEARDDGTFRYYVRKDGGQ
jgi:hypothetical protein